MMLNTIKRHPVDLIFGGQNAGNTTARRWLGAPFYAGTMPTSARSQWLASERLLTSIHIDCIAGTGSGNAIYTVYVDGIATAVTVVFLNAATTGEASGFAVYVPAGCRVSVALDKTGTITAGQTDITCMIGVLAP